ncbi:uncharacterized protein Pyn_17970 [Prunus yedoensis var. nudiflora]|uniref:Transposase MuDR plant domain-containing protein n=1 Tax=Prunus yedoensis var. nudiflora TaxID=2094558 RepID=A0A314ZSN1_PRUYE|nr:uncharacterized protein Pyn_17970 [Prunus yedoensis var. nudiflora]
MRLSTRVRGLEERGPIARNLTVAFEQSGYEGMYDEDEEDDIVVDEEDEGDEGTVHEAIHVKEEGDEGTILESTNVAEDKHEGVVPLGSYVAEEGDEDTVSKGINMDEEGDEGTVSDGINVEDETIYEKGENDKRAENESEYSEDPEFYDNACWRRMIEHLTTMLNDNAPDIDPATDEGEKSDDMAVSDVNSLDSSSCDEVDLPMRKRKRKRPKKAVKHYSVFNIRKIKFSKNDKDKVRAVCDGIKNGKCLWFVYA